jgi:hypothetical protein
MILFILLCFESRGLSVKMLALELTGINQGMRYETVKRVWIVKIFFGRVTEYFFIN